jgi:hypothetical protein
VCDDRICGRIIADGTVVLALDVEPQGILQQCSVLVIELHNIFFFKELHYILDACSTKCPVIAPTKINVSDTKWQIDIRLHSQLSKSEETLQDALELTPRVAVALSTVIVKGSSSFRSGHEVSARIGSVKKGVDIQECIVFSLLV